MTLKCDLNTSLDENLNISESLLNMNLFYNKNTSLWNSRDSGFTAFGASQKAPSDLTSLCYATSEVTQIQHETVMNI